LDRCVQTPAEGPAKGFLRYCVPRPVLEPISVRAW
jgi:hypothetical protein